MTNDLERMIRVVGEKLASIPPIKSDPYERYFESQKAHRAAAQQAFAALEAEAGAQTADNWNGAMIRLCGIRSTSTSGVAGALNNWIKAAKLKLAAEQRLKRR
ncbi:hypothetical protein FJU08_01280 [Martelella alba]|uniref:Uncharacterized protein n=1 Tax=Martelella alba TaxID=2590451 RepID=A0A506UIU0_9HYPH|nr:hypothetical protein [Martelella alba]TPW33226.1 hypothetical protein FJU08_01280 [Martelella alba]